MKVKIERFKNLRQVEIDVAGLTLLVGGNNAGKSSVLQAIQFGTSVAQTSKMVGGIWRGDRVATSIGQNELLYSPIKDVLSLGFNGQLRQSEVEKIEITYTDGADVSTISVLKGKNKNIRLEVEGEALGERLQSLDPPLSALVTGLAGIPSEEEFETAIVLRKAAARGDSNSIFRNILLKLKGDAGKWVNFSKQIDRIFPGYSIDVSFNAELDETIRCTVSRNGTPFPIDTCGTGVLQAIQIFSYVNLFAPPILLLDEPDSHLHPNNQKQLALELVAVAESGTHVVISTHSKHIIEALKDEAKLVWMQNGAVVDDVQDYELKALLDIGALNVGERIGRPSAIILTEDEDTSLIEKVLEVNGFDLDDCDVLSYSGCTNMGTAMTLISHIKRSHPNPTFIVHRDRDFLSQAEIDGYKAKLAVHGIQVFVPTGNDLESCFLTPEHVSAACEIDRDMADEVLQSAFDARRDELTRKYVNTRAANIQKAGDRPNAGELAVECAHAMNGPLSSSVHGKILLKGVRDELRLRAIQDRILGASPHLSIPALAAMAPR